MNVGSVSGKQAECQFCADTGMTAWHRPMSCNADGRVVMIPVPQICVCKAGDKWRNAQNLVQHPVSLTEAKADQKLEKQMPFSLVNAPTWRIEHDPNTDNLIVHVDKNRGFVITRKWLGNAEVRPLSEIRDEGRLTETKFDAKQSVRHD